jgi:putative ABC transport system permease protein
MWRHGRRKDDFSDEIRAHIEMETDRLVSEGLSAAEASAQARREFGNVTRAEERFYESNRLFLGIETLLRDLRYGARVLRGSPAFSLVAILSLALGIGANVALFQIIDAVMLRSLPVPNPQELVRIQWKAGYQTSGNHSDIPAEFSYPEWDQFRQKRAPFSNMFAWASADLSLTPTGEIRFAKGMYASGELFATLGVQPEIGRLLMNEDDRPGCGAGLAVLSHSFWQREYGGDPSVVGRKISLWGQRVEIVGVAPAWFTGVEVGQHFDVAVPLCARPAMQEGHSLNDRQSFWLGMFARLKPGVTVRQASTYVETVTPGILQSTIHPGWRPDTVKSYLKNRVEAVPGGTGYSALRRDVSRPLLVLLTIAGLVLLIACANLANLMLARASARQAEIGIRLSLGASRGRVVLQLLSESMLLALAGCVLGVLLAQLLSRYLIVSFGNSSGSPYLDLSLDWRMFAFMAGVSILACLLFGLVPALRATRTGSVAAAGSRGLTASRQRFALQRALVASQIALSLILVLTSLLFVRSFAKLVMLDPGFQEDGVLIVGVGLNDAGPVEGRRIMFQNILDALRHTSGVDRAAMVQCPPFGGSEWDSDIRIDGAAPGADAAGNAHFNRVSEGYFQTMAIPMYAGRDFNVRDKLGSLEVAIVDQSFSARFFHGQNPLGRTFHLETSPGETPHHIEIVGVVKPTKYESLQNEFPPIVYLAVAQEPKQDQGAWFAVHSRLPAGATTAAVRRSLARVNPNFLMIFKSLPVLAQDSVRRESLLAKLSGFFGLLAAILATLGLYGVSSYVVAQRRREIGLRLALGAQRRTILRRMLTQSCVLLLAGLGVGLVVALAAGRLAESLLFEVKPNDPWTVGLALAGVSLVSFVASLIPALKAANVPPMTALREE